MAARSTRTLPISSACGRKRTIQFAIFGDHARGGKSLRVLERLGTPTPALFGIGESHQIDRKIFFIVWLVQQGSCPRDVRHRTGGAAHAGATARLRFNNRPPESF